MSMLPRDAHRRLEVPPRAARYDFLTPIQIRAGDRCSTTWHADGSVSFIVERAHSVVPPIDYAALITQADAFGYLQGSPRCVAFARGAEWMREQVIRAQEDAQ